MMRKRMIAAALLLAATPAWAALPAPVARALRAAGLSDQQVGLHVEAIEPDGPNRMPVDAPPALAPPAAASHRADAAMNPASTMKLLTTRAALALLGPDYRWRTTWLTAGRMSGRTLRGDLVLRGGGDPKLVVEDLVEQVALLQARGIHAIDGDLVLDDSLWSVPRESEAIDGDASQPYNVPPNAAMMNFKAVRLTLTPVEGAVDPIVTLDPALAEVAIENDVVLLSGPCRTAPAPSVRDSGRDDAPAGIRVGGRWPAACGAQALSTAVLTHRQFVQALFRSTWHGAGGRWHGQARWGRAPDGAQRLLEWSSPRTLADVVRDVNKFSNNLMARSLLLQLGVERLGVPATPESGARAVRDWLANAGLSMPELVIENGAGLSRTERLSAGSLVALLREAVGSAHGELLRDSLPIAGVDGTMARRLRGEPLAGRAWIKTGSLSEVRSAAGYLVAQSGRRYALAMIVNGPRAEAAGEAIDELLRWLYANG